MDNFIETTMVLSRAYLKALRDDGDAEGAFRALLAHIQTEMSDSPELQMEFLDACVSRVREEQSGKRNTD